MHHIQQKGVIDLVTSVDGSGDFLSDESILVSNTLLHEQTLRGLHDGRETPLPSRIAYVAAWICTLLGGRNHPKLIDRVHAGKLSLEVL